MFELRLISKVSHFKVNRWDLLSYFKWLNTHVLIWELVWSTRFSCSHALAVNPGVFSLSHASLHAQTSTSKTKGVSVDPEGLQECPTHKYTHRETCLYRRTTWPVQRVSESIWKKDKANLLFPLFTICAETSFSSIEEQQLTEISLE